ncbi:MAG: SDR family NAD(P)-dependent oxidoreductase [Gemmatimonadota bacterium]|nr:MAG: SDR family NAD(P)-dependent oxidoreductase [Gemmatimonadota bacterium]
MSGGPVALITGASSGMGRGLALRLAAEGYRVGLAARREQPLEELAAEIRSSGGEALVLRCDVSVQEDVRAATERCSQEFGDIDLLVANAGQSEMTLVEDLDSGMIEQLMGVNFFGVVYAIEAVLPGMLDRGRGHIVGVSSLAAFGGLPRTAGYSAAKAAVTNFLESLRVDLRGRGVDVTVISPGYVRTPMTDRNLHSMPFLVELDDAVARIHRAIVKRARGYHFPWPLASFVWVGQIFPRRLYDWIVSRVSREKAR